MLKECRKCHEVKPLTEFYASPETKDRLSNHCKVCLRQYQQSRDCEVSFVNYLMSNGIYATLGRNAGAHKWIDVVAWGCVGVELKTSNNIRGRHIFTFSKKQTKDFTSQVIALEIVSNGRSSYYLFSSNDPIFFDGNVRKRSVFFASTPRKRAPVSVDLRVAFERAYNRFELIEQMRQAEIEKMLSGLRATPIHKRDIIPMKQLSMFDDVA